uniref:Uncharacterized protein LOC117351546 n=1 Tax=Geotrypetes seraphini TaxID=260995 RepID=A0A6P8Q722_GEOSA|nr:uncharacterized protein LOC117351546 [Geotrypetes seraphini]XP_033782830.1 uncharacterized protein LOC117351546 [Geotrypetes seraphini]XP_033782831.1 uncharacterized protein LOC117351546 [Geotrypetes seraphini]
MPPRIRLSFPNLLPTISETQEEILQDITNGKRCFGNFYINSDACSSDDYRQSICQLARPTFPTLADNVNQAWCSGTFRNIKNDHGLPRLPETQLVNASLQCKESPNTILMGKVSLELFHVKSNSCFRADPLEQLYALTQKTAHSKDSTNDVNSKTHYKQLENFSLCPNRRKHGPVLFAQETMEGKQNLSRVFSFPRLNSPRPMQRENSCPELNRMETSGTMAHSEVDSRVVREGTVSINEKIARPHKPEENLTGKRGSRRQDVLIKSEAIWEREDLETLKHNDASRGEILNSPKFSEYLMSDRVLFHNWISECKSAWKEAKTKAGLLPAIAEI